MLTNMNIKKILLRLLFGENSWAAAAIPKSYCDKDEIIRRILFASLVNFVEDEDDLTQGRDLADYADDLQAEHVTLDEIQKRIEWRQALYEAYQYIKEERPKLEVKSDWINIYRAKELDNETMKTIVKYNSHMWT